MHLSGWDAHAAVEWLHQHLGAYAAAPSDAGSGSRTGPRRPASAGDVPAKAGGQLRLPVANLAHLERVRRYLTQQRGLAAEILEPLIGAGKVYADGRGNAVFLMVVGKANRAVGAELRGTGQRVWHGLARGTRKDAGYFWVGHACSEQAGGSPRIVLCESAIDAISCFQLHARQLQEKCICISTAGIRPDAPWLQPLLARGYDIHCGFDDDEPGNTVADQLLRRHPSIKRLRPPAHDWNDALLASR